MDIDAIRNYGEDLFLSELEQLLLWSVRLAINLLLGEVGRGRNCDDPHDQVLR